MPPKKDNNMRSISPRAIACACLVFIWAVYSLSAEPLQQAVSGYQSGQAELLRYADND